MVGGMEEGVCSSQLGQGKRSKMGGIGLTTRWRKRRSKIFAGTTFASRLRMKGAPLEDITDLLRHKSLTVTRRFAHLGPNKLHGSVTTWSNCHHNCHRRNRVGGGYLASRYAVTTLGA